MKMRGHVGGEPKGELWVAPNILFLIWLVCMICRSVYTLWKFTLMICALFCMYVMPWKWSWGSIGELPKIGRSCWVLKNSYFYIGKKYAHGPKVGRPVLTRDILDPNFMWKQPKAVSSFLSQAGRPFVHTKVQFLNNHHISLFHKCGAFTPMGRWWQQSLLLLLLFYCRQAF